ncbi:hypothetical protein AMTR_s00158p00040970 [Amborella trichopoda]|uniref:Uncharacterized protein n=1 Tax=Amborella trichopoda TaxID=13333 RepID=W1PSC2_AMBTC|nr:hypothetical protein AMTR_s00158p00040970 [Amborella trichopoda]
MKEAAEQGGAQQVAAVRIVNGCEDEERVEEAHGDGWGSRAAMGQDMSHTAIGLGKGRTAIGWRVARDVDKKGDLGDGGHTEPHIVIVNEVTMRVH